jgi:hypothetical protein
MQTISTKQTRKHDMQKKKTILVGTETDAEQETGHGQEQRKNRLS